MYEDFMTMLYDIKAHLKANSSLTINAYNEMIPTEPFSYETEEEFGKAMTNGEIKFDASFGYKASDGTVWQIPIKNIKTNTPDIVKKDLQSVQGQKNLIDSLYSLSEPEAPKES